MQRPLVAASDGTRGYHGPTPGETPKGVTEGPDGEAANRLTRRASDLARTGTELEAAAEEWRSGSLE